MRRYLPFIFLAILLAGCGKKNSVLTSKEGTGCICDTAKDIEPIKGDPGQGALLATRFSSFEEFKGVVNIEYYKTSNGIDNFSYREPMVRLSHCSQNREVISILKGDIIDQGDFSDARNGDMWDKAFVAFNAPYAVASRNDFIRIFLLSRRTDSIYGAGDVAFFDLAEATLENIDPADKARIDPKDFGEKGFINTFNHVGAQAFATTLFSERLTDYIADLHERHRIPELITGNFTEEQITDLENGAVDNYVDMINNEWGQELGKALKQKYKIKRRTKWTPELLANYLNDLQSHYSWAFKIGFRPFRPADEIVIRFAKKINRIKGSVRGIM